MTQLFSHFSQVWRYFAASELRLWSLRCKCPVPNGRHCPQNSGSLQRPWWKTPRTDGQTPTKLVWFQKATTHNLYILWRHRLEALLKYNVISRTQWVDVNEKNAQGEEEGGCDIQLSSIPKVLYPSILCAMSNLKFETSHIKLLESCLVLFASLIFVLQKIYW